MTDPLERTIELDCPREHAWRVFTEMIDLWWPRGHRRDEAAKLVFQPHPGGRLFEKSTNGSEWTLGEVIAAEAPDRLEFNWFPGSPTAPTHVAVTFSGDGERSNIHIRHEALSAESAALWPDRVVLFAKGWDTILPALARHIAGP
jgi:uncharacterized protein YndB with AHSA1/START domain